MIEKGDLKYESETSENCCDHSGSGDDSLPVGTYPQLYFDLIEAERYTMRQIFTPRVNRCVVFLMLLALCLPQIQQFAVTEVSATMTQAEIDALEAEADELASQLSALQSELSAVSAEKDSYLAQKNNLEQQMNLIQAEINNIQSQIDQYDILIAEKMDDVAVAEAEEADQYALFCQLINSWCIIYSRSITT